MWDKKSNRDGYITIIPDGGCRKLASELNIIIRHFSPNITFDWSDNYIIFIEADIEHLTMEVVEETSHLP